MKKPQYIMVFVTVPGKKESDKITKEVLSKRLCACVNVISGINSSYWWKDKIENSKEILLVIKTIKPKFKTLEKCIKNIHPYEVPEIISLKIDDGSSNYLKWISQYAK